MAPLKRKVQNQLSGLVPTEPSCSSKRLAYVVTCGLIILFPTTIHHQKGHLGSTSTIFKHTHIIQRSDTKLQSVLSDIHRVFYLQKQKSDKLAGCKTPGRSKKRWDSDSQHFSNPLTFSNSQSYRAVIVDKSSCCDHGGSGSDQIDPRLSLMALNPCLCWLYQSCASNHDESVSKLRSQIELLRAGNDKWQWKMTHS